MNVFPRQPSLPRRQFLAAAGGTIAAPMLFPGSSVSARPAPSDRITVGVIGLGSRGFNLIDSFLEHSDAEIVAVCDVDRLHYRDRTWGQGTPFGREPAAARIKKARAQEKSGSPSSGPAVYSDYRELIAHDDLDAVVVATPDHWHALCTLEALQAGKDVYCEKPVTHWFAEGQRVYREVELHDAVFQTGSQQRSDPGFRRVVELVRNGHLGKLSRIEVGLPPGYDVAQGDTKIQVPPDSLDYEFWCGPAQKLPYMRARHHRWWRGHRAYGGGVLMDWIGHHNDIAHWALDTRGPNRVAVSEWTAPSTDVYNTPHHYSIECSYDGGISSTISSRNTQGLKLIGSDGWVYARRGRLEASDPQWVKPDFDPGERRVARSDDHTQNFLDSVKSRRPCIASAETAHRSITPGHLAYVAHSVGRPLAWDPKREQIINDEVADEQLRSIPYREPWSL